MNNAKQKVKEWWAKNPQTYGDTHGQAIYSGDKQETGTLAFFEQVDQRFYRWNTPLHNKEPFDGLFPYDQYSAGSRVLEIGCGMGTMAMNWAKHGAHITAIDLNPTSIKQTQKRFELYGLEGDIRLADANHLAFENNQFDYTYSWGVLHHSPNLARSLAEMMRVTKPGGGFGMMLYNRHSLLYWYTMKYVEGFLHYENQFLGPLEFASRYGDGHREEGNPYTWPVTSSEIKELLRPFSNDVKVKILGTDLDSIFRSLLPGLGLFLPTWLKKVWARRYGWSLWIYGHKA